MKNFRLIVLTLTLSVFSILPYTAEACTSFMCCNEACSQSISCSGNHCSHDSVAGTVTCDGGVSECTYE
jgi:hypothetical protein